MKAKHSLFLLLAALLAPWAANAQDNNTIILNENKNIAIQPGQTYNFYDSGGPDGNYGKEEDYTLTLTCDDYITINFSQFQTEPTIASNICSDYRDYMLIYDGEVSDGNLITRGQTGCSSSLDTGTDYMATSGIMTIKWKSNNGTEDSGWVATITGVCAPVVVNSNSVYTENFDSYTSLSNGAAPPNVFPDDPLPQCWQFINRSNPNVYGSYPLAYITTSSFYAANGNCLLFSSSGVKDLYAILPQFEGNISGYQLTFTYRNEGTTDDDGTLYVGYMTNPNDTTTFVQTLECPKRAALTTKAAFFLQAPQGSYIAFKYGGGAYNYNLSIDDVVVSVVPSCIPTGTPTCGELSAHTAKLSWDLVDATQTAWEVEYSTSIEFAGALTVDATTHEDFELTGLVAETTYYARVRAKCGNDDPSAWSETITFTTFNICPVPFNLAANNLTAAKADLSWTGSIDVPSYDVRHRKAYHVIGDYERFDTRPDGWDQKFQELDRVLNGEGWEEGEAYGRIPWMFGTQNGVFDSHAYLYDFGHSHQWLITDSYTVKSSDAFNFDLALTGYNEFNTTDFLEPEITETNYRFIVLIIKDSDYNPGPTACKEWEILREWNNTGSEYVFNNIAYSPLGEHVSIDLSGYVGQTVRIAFYGESSQYTDGNTLHIDNMAFGAPVAATPWEYIQDITANTATVTEVLRNLNAEIEYEAQVKSNCSDSEVWCAPLFFTTLEAPDAPTGLQVVEGSITATGASFSWNGEANESFQYFTVTNPQEGFEPTEATVWTNVQGNTVNVMDAFTPNRVARFYLRKDCGDDGLSKYTYVEFRTGCGTMVIDDINSYTENFDSYTAGTSDAQAPSTYPNDPLPQCWQFLNRSNGSGYPQVFISTHQNYIVSGNCLFFKSSYSTSLYAILPEFAQPVANLKVTFTYRNEGTDSNNGTLHVGYMIDPSDASTFVSTLECRKTTALTTMTAYFPHAPEQGRMAFMYKGGDGEPYYLSIDDVEVSLAPSCLHTGKPSCGELSSQTAKLSWDLIDAMQTAWDVQYSTSQDFAEYSTVIANTHENFELRNLVPETQYYARVRARCSDEAFSAWSETITFTTFSTCPVPFNLAVSNITQVSAVLSWSGTIDVQSYDVRYKSTAASSWRTIQDITATTAVLSNLNAYTEYEAQVKSNCSNPEAWSASVVFETGYSGIVPSDLQVSDITATGATFTWNGEETESFQYCAVTNPQAGFDPTDWINVQGNTVRLENAFTPNRPARFYLRKDFGNQAVSRYTYVDFHTDCGPMVLSFDGDNDFYFEDFEGYEGNSCIGNEFSGTLPRCWDGYFTSQYEQPEVIAGWAPHIISSGNEYCYYHHSGTNSLFFFGREYGYAALPYFANPISTLRISFWMKRDSGGTLVLGYIKSGDVNYNTFTPIAEFEDSYFSMVQHSKDLNEVPAEATRLVFRWFAEGASYECCIDDVKVSLLPTCQPPTGLAVGNVTSTGANFTWEAEDDETFQYFTISNPSADFEPTQETNWTVVHGNTMNLTNVFEPNTLVRLYIRKGCGNGGYSDYTSVAFRTICVPISLVNYSENFDSYTGVSGGIYPIESIYPFDPLPDCWRFLTRPEVSYHDPQVFISSDSDYAVEGNCLFFRSHPTTPIYAILPEFEENISGYQLSFIYRNEGTSESNGTLYIGYMTDPNDATTFVQTLACPKTTDLTTATAYFTDAPQGSYMAFKYVGGTYNGYFASIDNVVVSEAPTCFPTGKPTSGELSAHTAKLNWDLVDPTQTQNVWEVQYSKTSDFSEATVVTATTHEDFQITGLDAETQYHVQVRTKCSETDFGTWSETLTLTTLSTCPVPTDLVANNLTQESAKINWIGSIDVESYAVRYHKTDQVVGIDERFNTALLPEGWESKKGLLSDIMGGGAFEPSNLSSWDFGANAYGVSEKSAYLVVYGADCKEWLITKRHTVASSDAFTFGLSISGTDPSSQIQTGSDDRFVVLITADDGRTWNILREWNNSGSENVYINISPYTFQQESIDLSGYVGQTVRIAFYGESTVSNASNCLHLDNVTFGTPMAASEPQTQTGITGNQETAANSVVIQGLVANTEYEVQVKSECSNPEEWSDPITFRTLDPYMKVFVGGDISGADEWSNPNNWVPAGVPTINQGVELQANATIRSGCVAEANQIEGDYGLTIEDGGQLRTNNEVEATVQKNITGYGRGGSHWYLIASPVKETLTPDGDSVTNIVTTESAYDLYSFDGSQQGAEWRNYKQHEQTFRFRNGLGYLVAKSVGITQSFKGTVLPSNQTKTVELDFAETTFGAWNLVGNPYTCVAYLSDNHSFYRLEETTEGSRIVLAEDNAIAPMEGVFVEAADGDDAVTFTTTAPTAAASALNFSLHKVEQARGGVSTGSTALDRIRISIGEGRNLGHLDLMADANRLYIPLGDKDMAVVSVQPMGELPLNFEAAEEGTYTLSFENATEGLVYCHLIDNLTGADIDLLTPAGFPLYKGGQGDSNAPRQAEYTFTAKKSDYASRFKVVFATVNGDANGNSEPFAFNHNGNWIIANEGRATLQVIDLTGRILSSEQIEGSVQTQINQPAGLYLIRLVNGDNVKVQKVVVR